MSWSTIFPIYTPDHVSEYEAQATPQEKAHQSQLFAVKRWVNRRKVGHIISTSLFWRNINLADPDTPTPTRESMMKSVQRRSNKIEIAPWEHYVLPLLEGAKSLHASGQDAVFRVYLAADLAFLIPDLVAAGCEIALMQHSSIRHNPGAMWRYLALEDAGRSLVSFTDADRAKSYQQDMGRTVEASRVGLGFWRVPTWGETNHANKVAYRPILGCQLGACQRLSVRRLMEALVWSCEHGKIQTTAAMPGCGSQEIHGAVWPNYGFDEWFLLSCVYPRVAAKGVLSFVPASAKSKLLPMDIEYVMWMNPRSELVHFGASGGNCCAPAATKPVKRKSNGRVLLTGIWQVKTPGDVVLINELCDFAKQQDVAVEFKPVLHVKDPAKIKKLPAWLLKEAVFWNGLEYNVGVQRSLLHAVSHGTECDWVWQADSDERVDFACVGGLAKILRKADREGVDYVVGDWIDRIGPADELPQITAKHPLSVQFPRTVLAVSYFGKSLDKKIALHRKDCLTQTGNHEPEKSTKLASTWKIPIWHFKWHSECLPNQRDKLQADRNAQWSWEMDQTVHKLEATQGARIDWGALPPEAWPKRNHVWKKGYYAC